MLLCNSRSLSEAPLLRGYFLMRLAIDNGARPTEVINLETEWALNAKHDKQMNQLVMKVYRIISMDWYISKL